MKMDENGGWKRMEKECIGMDKMGNKWENHGNIMENNGTDGTGYNK